MSQRKRKNSKANKAKAAAAPGALGALVHPEDAGIEVCLVNARHVKGVPGKKTDVVDAAWLQQLHAAGLLRSSFRPRSDILPLRYLMRHRGDLLAQAGQQVQLMQKVMTESSGARQPAAGSPQGSAGGRWQMNLHTHHVFSDVDGENAQRIINAILAGERDPQTLAALRDRRCRAPLAKVQAALVGDYRDEYLFVLRQCQTRWRELCAAIAEADKEIAQRTAALAGETDAPLPPAGHERRRIQKNMPTAMPVHEEARRILGVDLSQVPGVSGGVLCVFMSELGTASPIRQKFRSAEAFASWLGLCPDNRISGGRILSTVAEICPTFGRLKLTRVVAMEAGDARG